MFHDVCFSVSTNHTLGYQTALDAVDEWSKSEYKTGKRAQSVLIIYITRSLLLEPQEVDNIIPSIATKVNEIKTNIIFSIFGLGFSNGKKYSQFIDLLLLYFNVPQKMILWIEILWTD